MWDNPIAPGKYRLGLLIKWYFAFASNTGNGICISISNFKKGKQSFTNS